MVANRLLPVQVTDPWFDRWRSAQAEHLATIDEAFAPLPILRAHLADDEVVGLDRLRRFGQEVYAEVDPRAVLHDHEPMRVRKKGEDDYRLSLDLPFAEHDQLDVGRRGDELIVRVGPYRRSLLLPDSLRRRQVTGATLRKGRLRVSFGPVSSPGRAAEDGGRP